MADERLNRMEEVLRKQRAAHHQMRPEPMALRKDRIERSIKLLKDHADDLCKVMSADFGNRSPQQSMMTDIAGTVNFGTTVPALQVLLDRVPRQACPARDLTDGQLLPQRHLPYDIQ